MFALLWPEIPGAVWVEGVATTEGGGLIDVVECLFYICADATMSCADVFYPAIFDDVF